MEDHDDHDHASLMLEDDPHDHHDEDEMEEEEMDIEPTRVVGVDEDEDDEFWDHEASKEEIWEMKKTSKRPSEWLKLLCREWAEADENLDLVETVDEKFESYKPYLKGKLSSQLLCRLCIPSDTDGKQLSHSGASKPDFLKSVLAIDDDFDKAYVIAQVERFCAVYDIRGVRQQAEVAGVSGSTSSSSSNASTTCSPQNHVHTTANHNQNHNQNQNHNPNRFAVPNNEATAAAAAALYGDLVVNATSLTDVHQQAIAAAAAATAANHPSLNLPHQFLTADATAAAVAAAQQAAQQQSVAVNGENHHHQQQQHHHHQHQQPNHHHHHHQHHKSVKGSESSSGASAGSNGNNQVFAASHKTAQALLTKAQQQAKSAERALEQERRQNAKREQRRLSQDKKLARQRDREFLQKQKQAEKVAREKAREEKRTRKLLQRQERERFAQEQKEAALRRAAELVASNRVPIEITRAGGRGRGRKPAAVLGLHLKPELGSPGVAASKMVPAATLAGASSVPSSGGTPVGGVDALGGEGVGPKKRQRSAIVVSTASDLDRIVTHSQNLWAKYNAIAKEHNQRVNWITVAKELGIHVKVREKYARMHSRACQRNFDFIVNGNWKIKDHPEIFQEPTPAEQKARMPPPLPPPVDDHQAAAAHQAAVAEAVAIVDRQHGKEMIGLDHDGSTESGGLVLGTYPNQNGVSVKSDSSGTARDDEGALAGLSGQGKEGEASGGSMAKESYDGNNEIAGNANGPAAAPATATPPIPPPHDPLDAAAAAATAAAVVDAAGVGGAAIDMHHVAAVAAATADGAGAAATVAVGGGEDVVVGYGI
eukprot:CAMPEP_0172378514 /NCGR_PEP_ID=MMETSP1060-20121228/69458_1 /TAXON_ID=37318 /ORGANISM="Pseudo-nitzschia pungens, Strain cf. cingulata" /LENGTH=822 /DNA_ID=CAMNT_0013106235 /DNA_START=539 /DNA_END=3007 /DNA_ORIENTATION=-